MFVRVDYRLAGSEARGKSRERAKFVETTSKPLDAHRAGGVVIASGDDRLMLLCHRRSKAVSESHTIAAPGGLVTRKLGFPDFGAGARATALQELREEAGVTIDSGILFDLPVGEVCSRKSMFSLSSVFLTFWYQGHLLGQRITSQLWCSSYGSSICERSRGGQPS